MCIYIVLIFNRKLYGRKYVRSLVIMVIELDMSNEMSDIVGIEMKGFVVVGFVGRFVGKLGVVVRGF